VSINGILNALGVRVRIGTSKLGPLALTGVVVPSAFTEHVERVAAEMYKCQMHYSADGSVLSYFQSNKLILRNVADQFEKGHAVWQGTWPRDYILSDRFHTSTLVNVFL
jgi:hypothetical protein